MQNQTGYLRKTIQVLTCQLQQLKNEISDLMNTLALNKVALRVLSSQNSKVFGKEGMYRKMIEEFYQRSSDMLKKNTVLMEQNCNLLKEKTQLQILLQYQRMEFKCYRDQAQQNIQTFKSMLLSLGTLQKQHSNLLSTAAQEPHQFQRLEEENRRLKIANQELEAINKRLLQKRTKERSRSQSKKSSLVWESYQALRLGQSLEKCREMCGELINQ